MTLEQYYRNSCRYCQITLLSGNAWNKCCFTHAVRMMLVSQVQLFEHSTVLVVNSPETQEAQGTQSAPKPDA
jgi:hypothetical protein